MPVLNANESTTETTTPATESPTPVAPKAPKPKAAAKKAAVKAAPVKKAAVKKTAEKKEKVVVVKEKKPARERVSDTTKTPLQKTVSVLKAMRTLGALNAGSAVNVEKVSKKCGLNEFDTYGALYKTHRLQVELYVKQVKVEGIRGAAFHLTAKGQKGDPE